VEKKLQIIRASECVEVAARCGDRIDIRDSKNPRGTVLRFTSTEWSAFVADIRTADLGRGNSK
jgi:hypothetical protein